MVDSLLTKEGATHPYHQFALSFLISVTFDSQVIGKMSVELFLHDKG
jgi:hypothetical protein